MNANTPDPQPTEFIHRSEKESICASCFSTVRSDGHTPLKVVEEIHADVCLMKPGSPVRYALL